MKSTKLSIMFLALILSSAVTHSKVEPPNYDFSLDQFAQFMPGKKLAEIEKIHPNKELMINDGQFKTYKFYIEHIRYKFVILVQFNQDLVSDFHARLPNYFLHNIFHQSLINRLGDQDIYKKKEEQAVYLWKNKNGNQHLYMGSCTITCFPVYYAVKSNNLKGVGEFKSITQRLSRR